MESGCYSSAVATLVCAKNSAQETIKNYLLLTAACFSRVQLLQRRTDCSIIYKTF